MTRPDSTEYAPYYGKYVSLVPDGPIVATLGNQIETTLDLLRGLSETQGDSRYAPGKWTIKELVGHVIDAERIFAYRALRIARNDKTPLPGFEQDDFVAGANFNAIPLAELTDELAAVRESNLRMFRHLTDDAWLRRGTASDNEVSARALAYIIAGHELYHLDILKTRYL